QGLAAGLLDDHKGLALALLIGAEQAANTGGLDGHDADAVADDVVELPRDPRPLLGDRQPRLLLALSLEALGPFLGQVALEELLPEHEPYDPGDPENDRREDEVPGVVALVVRDDRDRSGQERGAGDGLVAVPEHAEHEGDDEAAEEADELVV